MRLKEFVGRNLLAKPNLLGDAPNVALTPTVDGGVLDPLPMFPPAQGAHREGVGLAKRELEEVERVEACGDCSRGHRAHFGLITIMFLMFKSFGDSRSQLCVL